MQLFVLCAVFSKFCDLLSMFIAVLVHPLYVQSVQFYPCSVQSFVSTFCIKHYVSSVHLLSMFGAVLVHSLCVQSMQLFVFCVA